MEVDRVAAVIALISSALPGPAGAFGSDPDAAGGGSPVVRRTREDQPNLSEAPPPNARDPHADPGNREPLSRSEGGGGAPPAPTTASRIVAYTWEPVPTAADRLVYAIKVDRRNYDVQSIADQLEAMPPGHRAIRLWKWAEPDLTRHPDDVCQDAAHTSADYWYPQPEAGLREVRSRWEGFVEQLSAAGAPLDEVIVDFEAPYTMWNMEEEHPAAIMADPRWEGIASEEAGPLVDLSNVLDYRHSSDYLIWNAASARIVDAALQAAIYEPLRQRYAGVRCSNFGSLRVLRQHVVPSVMGAHPQWRETEGFGTHEGVPAYGTLSDYTGNHIMRGSTPLGTSPYAAFLYTIKRIESVEASSTRPLMVWVCNRNKTTDKPRPVRGTPYNDEIIRHMVVRGHGLMLWNAWMGDDVEEMMQTSAIIDDAATRIGDDTQALPSVTGWPNTVVHSVAVGPDRVVHRFTLEFPDEPLRYRINDVEYVRFPPQGEVGVWVTHAPDDEFGLLQRERRFVVVGIND